MQIKDLIATIELIAPLPYQSSWDKSGVQIASYKQKIRHLGVTLDPVPTIIQQAEAASIDFLLTHHPLSLNPRFPDQIDTFFACLSKTIKADMWLYSAHTSLDAQPKGPVQWLAEALNLQNVRVLEPSRLCHMANTPIGFGFIGSLNEQIPWKQFEIQLQEILGSQMWRSCGPQCRFIHTVACCPGSGAELMKNAHLQNADIFITGDVKYHAALEAPIWTLDVGHFVLEEQMMKILAAQLADVLPVPVTFFPGIDPFSPETTIL